MWKASAGRGRNQPRSRSGTGGGWHGQVVKLLSKGIPDAPREADGPGDGNAATTDGATVSKLKGFSTRHPLAAKSQPRLGRSGWYAVALAGSAGGLNDDDGMQRDPCTGRMDVGCCSRADRLLFLPFFCRPLRCGWRSEALKNLLPEDKADGGPTAPETSPAERERRTVSGAGRDAVASVAG
jgi:hypothetical protein